MDLKQYKRDGAKIHACLLEQSDGHQIIAKRDVKIYIPTRFRDKNLATIGSDIFILGIYLITTEDESGKYYAVEVTDAMMQIEPSNVNTVTLNGTEMFEFEFFKGDVVVSNTQLVQNAKLLYYIFEEFVGKGNVPPYMNYIDMCRTFSTATKHAGVVLSSTPTILEMLISMIGRDPKAPMTYFRQITNGKDFDNVLFVPLRSPIFGATNATAKLLGAYPNDAMTSILVTESTNVEDIETILRV